MGDSPGISTFDPSRYMGASLTKIDCHYGHLVHDGRGHAIRLLDEISAPANVHGGRWWTLRGRQSPSAAASQDNGSSR